MAAFPPAASIRVPASTCRVAADFRRHLRRRNFDSTQTPPLSAHYLSKSPHRNLGTKIVRRLVVASCPTIVETDDSRARSFPLC